MVLYITYYMLYVMFYYISYLMSHITYYTLYYISHVTHLTLYIAHITCHVFISLIKLGSIHTHRVSKYLYHYLNQHSLSLYNTISQCFGGHYCYHEKPTSRLTANFLTLP